MLNQEYRFRCQLANLGFSPIMFAMLCLLWPWGALLAQSPNADEYVTGMTLAGAPGAEPSCPLIVWFVEPDTPAAAAGIQPGDRLLAIDGHRGIDAVHARQLLHTLDSKPTTVELEGEHGTYTVTLGRIKESTLLAREGWK